PTPTTTPSSTPDPTPAPTSAPPVEAASTSTPTATATSETGGPPALRLSEVLADPVEPGVDGAYEWVELVNTASVAVSTAGWAIGDATSLDPLPAVEVPPGGYVVIAAEMAVLPVNVLVARAPDGTIGNGLNNAGDAVRLVSPAGDVVDSLSFGENRSVLDSPPPAAPPGATLGARFAGDRWAETLRPSPGAPNTFVEPTATPTPAPTMTPSPAAAPTATAAATGVGATPAPLPVRFERESGSRTPWIALGAVAGASLALTFAAARGALGRWRRGG
ncbi:MAG: lamin tail domain-containing protein, partial [Dehalococcoidia bacterium]|nr:lamin tail domain-containing protein [Dehalococcoidia bacterium]